MFVVIDNIRYSEGEIVSYENSYGIITGVVKYGEWYQDGSGGEYYGRPCYGWYVEFLDIELFDYETDTKEEVLESMPEFEKHQSLLYLIRDGYIYENFHKVNEV